MVDVGLKGTIGVWVDLGRGTEAHWVWRVREESMRQVMRWICARGEKSEKPPMYYLLFLHRLYRPILQKRQALQ